MSLDLQASTLGAVAAVAGATAGAAVALPTRRAPLADMEPRLHRLGRCCDAYLRRRGGPPWGAAEPSETSSGKYSSMNLHVCAIASATLVDSNDVVAVKALTTST